MITEEMRKAAYVAAAMKMGVTFGRWLTIDGIDAALEAVAPMIRNTALEEAAKKAGHFATSEDNEICARNIASAIRALATPSVDGEGE